MATTSEEIAKLHIIRKEYKEAYEYLINSLSIKEEIFRYKPDSKELK